MFAPCRRVVSADFLRIGQRTPADEADMRLPALPLLIALTSLAAPSADAAVYVVNTVDVDLPDTNTMLAGCDANPVVVGDQCTLRAAIMQANAGPGHDTIVLPLDTQIPLTLAGAGGAEAGDLDITASVSITSAVLGLPDNVARFPHIVASHNERIFDIAGGGLEIDLLGMRLSGGIAPGIFDEGGAIRVAAGATLSVEMMRFEDNQAFSGGAIANAGFLEVSDSDFLLNQASALGAALRNTGVATLRRSSLRQSRDNGASSEAVSTGLDSFLTLENVTIDGNDSGAGATASGGVRFDRPSLLQVRNSTIVDTTMHSLAGNTDASTTIRVHNSVIKGHALATDDCEFVPLVAGADIQVTYSIVAIDSSCWTAPSAARIGIVTPAQLDLQALVGVTHSFVRFRIPLLNSLMVDSGVAEGNHDSPAEACLADDTIGNMRPQDGDGNGTSRCDTGATERAMTQSSTYVVNLYTQDLPDFLPGDDVCDAIAESAGAQCTLRAAVMEANAKAGPDFIEFLRDDNNANTLMLTRANPGAALWGDLDITEQLRITGLTENGRPITTVVGDMDDRLFDIQTPIGHFASFFDLRLTGGDTDGHGGAIRLQQGDFLFLSGVELASNQATLGGGALANLDDGSLSIVQSDIHDNQADTNGAAIYSTGHTFLQTSSVTNNTTLDGMLPEVVVIDDNGTREHRVAKNTISGNSGGVRADQAGELRVQANTIVDNGGYGLRSRFGGQLTLLTTIIADHEVLNCSIDPAVTTNTDNYNYFGGASCPLGASNVVGDPQLAPALTRVDFGITRVRVPLPGSPVVDAVPIIPGSLRCNESDTDQLGATRPRDGDGDGVDECDIGAREVFEDWHLPLDFTVNVFAVDQVDAVPGDTRCDTSSSTPGDQCTLRAAAMESNTLPGANIIHVPGGNTAILTRAPAGGGPAADGDLDLPDAVEILGSGATPDERAQVLASHGDRIFDLSGAADYRIANLRLSGGTTATGGGAIRTAGTGARLLERLELGGNSADDAGGALEVQSGEVTLLDSDVHHNTSPGDGTAITVGGELTVERSSVRANIDSSPGTPGEAIRVESSGSLLLRNSTVSSNDGDGVGVSAGGSLGTRTTTIAANTGLGVRFQPGAGVESLVLHTTVLTANVDGGCDIPSGTPDTLTVDRYNLSQDGDCGIAGGGSNVVAADAALTPLQVDPTLWSAFHVPLPDSPAIDNGHPVIGGVGCPAEDQHGVARPVDGDNDGNARCDIGSVEAPIPTMLFSDGFEG